MEQRLSVITLGVKNLTSATDFYTSLGWKLAPQSDKSISMFNLQTMAFALYQRKDLADDATVHLSNAPEHPAFTLAHNVESEATVDAILAQAETAGGKLIKPAQKVFWGGYSGYFADLDGFLWEVAFNPFSKLGPNGEFNFGGLPQ